MKENFPWEGALEFLETEGCPRSGLSGPTCDLTLPGVVLIPFVVRVPVNPGTGSVICT